MNGQHNWRFELALYQVYSRIIVSLFYVQRLKARKHVNLLFSVAVVSMHTSRRCHSNVVVLYNGDSTRGL